VAALFHPEYRSHILIDNSVKKWYCLACIFQVIWTLAFCNLAILSSVVVLAFNIFATFNIVVAQGDASTSTREFWIYRFPIHVNLGWLYALFFYILQIWHIDSAMFYEYQVSWSYASLLLMVLIGFLHGLVTDEICPTVPFVLSWASVRHQTNVLVFSMRVCFYVRVIKCVPHLLRHIYTIVAIDLKP